MCPTPAFRPHGCCFLLCLMLLLSCIISLVYWWEEVGRQVKLKNIKGIGRGEAMWRWGGGGGGWASRPLSSFQQRVFFLRPSLLSDTKAKVWSKFVELRYVWFLFLKTVIDNSFENIKNTILVFYENCSSLKFVFCECVFQIKKHKNQTYP